MKITLLMGGPDGSSLKVVPPFEGSDHANVPGAKCPHCNHEPLQIQGTGKHIKNHSTYAAGAVCTSCDKYVGEINAKVNTLFGIEEDELVFRMGAKIY